MLIIKIVNDGTGTRRIGNYRYQVLINDTVIESGTVKEHHREDGWQVLVDRLVDNSLSQAMKNQNQMVHRKPPAVRRD
jgi:hypothetical protein